MGQQKKDCWAIPEGSGEISLNNKSGDKRRKIMFAVMPAAEKLNEPFAL